MLAARARLAPGILVGAPGQDASLVLTNILGRQPLRAAASEITARRAYREMGGMRAGRVHGRILDGVPDVS